MTPVYSQARLEAIARAEKLARVLRWAAEALADLETEEFRVTDIITMLDRLEAARVDQRAGPKKAGER